MKDPLNIMVKRLLLLSILCLAIGKSAMATNYYVSNSGNDSNNGRSLSTPFKTVQKAASVVQAGDNVFVRGGTYREEVEITTSGSSGKPIVFTAYNNENVEVTTTNLVGGWTSDKGNIYKISFNSKTMGREGMTVFVDDEWVAEAHWSSKSNKVNYLELTDYSSMDSKTATSITDAELGKFSNDYWNNAFVWVQKNNWTMKAVRIKDFTGGSGKITLDDNLSFSTKKELKYLIFDSYKALDAPGEWYFDESKNILYMWSPKSTNPNVSKVEIKVRDYCFNLNGKDYIQFKGINFKAGGVKMANSNGVLLQGAKISYPDWDFGLQSTSGVIPVLEMNGFNNVVRDNEIVGVCGKFIELSGGNNSIVNNYFHDMGYGNDYGAAIDIDRCEGGNLISHNTFDRLSHSAIAGVAGYQFIIQYNEFSNTCILTTDVGAIGFGNSSYSNSKIHHNVFHEMATLSAGLYMDNYCSDIVFHHNILYNNVGWGLKINMPASNILCFNNTIYNNGHIDAYSATTNISAEGVRVINNIYSYIYEPRFLSGGAILEGNYKTSSSSNFVNAANGDFRLTSGSGAIDAGVEIETITDDFKGSAPDVGALEYGETMWEYGHDFSNPPNPTYKWYTVPFTNLITNSGFENELAYWNSPNGTPEAVYTNTWQYKDIALGTSGSGVLELKPEDRVEQVVKDLEPNTLYKLTARARILRKDIKVVNYNASSGTFSKGYYANEYSLTGLNSGEWTRYDDIDFGTDEPLFNRIDIGHTESATLEVRLDNINGELLANVNLIVARRGSWSISSENISSVTGKHNIYLKFNSEMGSTRLDRIRLLNTKTTEEVKIGAKDYGAGSSTVSAAIGFADWTGKEGLIFKTGASTTQATVFIEKLDGGMNGYVEAVSLKNTEVIKSAFKKHTIPGTIQVENFDNGGQGIGYNVINLTNSTSSYRSGESVVLETTDDQNGNYHVGNLKAGEWLDFTVSSIEAGVYNIELRYATANSTDAPVLKLDNDILGKFSSTNTGSLQSWKTTTLNSIEIPGVSNGVIRLEMPEGLMNINYIRFIKKSNVTLPAVANFSVSTSAEINEVVTFSNTSENATNYTWDFGDGTSSSLENPIHTYSSVGAYEVKLTVSNTLGTSSKNTSIEVINSSVSPSVGIVTLFRGANYSSSSETLAVGTHNVLTYNNDASSIQIPEGYQVTVYENTNRQGGSLVITESLSSFVNQSFDTNTQLNDNVSSIFIEDLNAPVAEFSLQSTADVGEEVSFTNNSINSTGYNWSFGDGASSTEESPIHTYSTEGEYTVSLTATNDTEAYSVTTQVVSILDITPPSISDKVLLLYRNTNYSGASIDLGVGTHNSISFDNDASSIQVAEGLRVTLFENKNLQGGRLELTSSLNNFVNVSFDNGQQLNDNVSSILIEDLSPVADFTSVSSSLVGSVVVFDNTSENANLFVWSFGDGTTSNLLNPSKNYSSAGVYTVKLIATSSFGSSEKESVITISNPVTSSNSGSVSLFSSTNYGGKSEELEVGTYTTIEINNQASSISVPSGIRVTLYQNENMQGGKLELTEDMSTFVNNNFDNGTALNDKVSSIVVEDLLAESDEFISFYTDGLFTGAVYQLKVGIHNSVDRNDSYSSVEIPLGYRVTLFENINLQGGQFELTEDLDRFWLSSFDNGESLNDNVSSILIEKIDGQVNTDSCSMYVDGIYTGRIEKLGVGIYNSITLNNGVSSIKIPAGLRVTLYDGVNLTGGSIELTEDLDRFWFSTFSNGESLNDGASSVLVEDISGVSNKSGKLSNNEIENHNNQLEDINIWPNPSPDYIHVDFPTSDSRTVSVYDMMGAELYNNLVNSAKHTINITEYENGNYIIMVTNQDTKAVITKSFLKSAR